MGNGVGKAGTQEANRLGDNSRNLQLLESSRLWGHAVWLAEENINAR
jgi:hypothetical protein